MRNIAGNGSSRPECDRPGGPALVHRIPVPSGSSGRARRVEQSQTGVGVGDRSRDHRGRHGQHTDATKDVGGRVTRSGALRRVARISSTSISTDERIGSPSRSRNHWDRSSPWPPAGRASSPRTCRVRSLAAHQRPSPYRSSRIAITPAESEPDTSGSENNGSASRAGRSSPDSISALSGSGTAGSMMATGTPLRVISTLSLISTRANTSAVCWCSSRTGICRMWPVHCRVSDNRLGSAGSQPDGATLLAVAMHRQKSL